MSESLLHQLTFCIIDLETTGGLADRDQIFEIGLVRIEGMAITEERSFLLNPQKEIPEFVQRLTGVRMSDVQLAPVFSEIIHELYAFIGDSILVAHNTSFDIPFLNAKLKSAGHHTLENKVLCTNVMTKYMIPEIVNSNLEYMGKIFNLGEAKAHKAIDDAKITARLLLKYLEIFEKKNIKKVNQLYYPRNKFELDRKHFESSDQEQKKLFQFLKQETRPLLLQTKSELGVLTSLLAIKSPSETYDKIHLHLNSIDWNSIQIKLTGPYLDGLIFLNENLLKIPSDLRQTSLQFHEDQNSQHQTSQEGKDLFDRDALILPHLIEGQLCYFSPQDLSSQSRLVFKLPAHKKKFSQFLQNKIKRHPTSRKKTIHPELNSLFENHLFELSKSPAALFSKENEIKEDLKGFLQRVEVTFKKNQNPYSYPNEYI